MNMYQIYEATEQLNHAGSKATHDVACIAEQLGFHCLRISQATTEESLKGKISRQLGYLHDWKEADKAIHQGDIVLLQHPFHHRQATREKTLIAIKQKKQCRIISFVHDVEELRGYRYNSYYNREFSVMLSIADRIIVHNDSMKEWFLKRGVRESKLITLGIFDYLVCEEAGQIPQFDRTLTIAGNLDTIKSGYIKKLGECKPLLFDLYGQHFDEGLRIHDNIRYHGEAPENEITKKLTKGFGLVWDGKEINGCQGEAGQYLKYNSPHKLSLYLASGLPVVIWSGAAESAFVKKHELGFCVDRIEDCIDKLNQVSVDTWAHYVDNVGKIGKRLRAGYYTKHALETAVKRVSD